MDRCELFSKLTKSSDLECTLFEEVLEKFFSEYSGLYGAMDDANAVDDIVDIECISTDTPKFAVSATLSSITIDGALSEKITDFLEGYFGNTHNIHTEVKSEDTIIIEIERVS